MVEGIDNLAKLFEAKVIPRPPGMPEENFQGHQFQFRQDLGTVLSVLNAPKGTDNGPLSKTIYQDRPLLPLDRGRSIAQVSGYSLETAYLSGYNIAAILFVNPSRTGRMEGEAQTIYGKHAIFRISPETTIMATRRIVVDGVLVHDSVSALENYISAFEEQVKADIAELDGEAIITKNWFSFSPDVGLGLVGFGDAMLKAAQTKPQRAPEYLDLAKRAYRSSGYGNTLYVGNKLLGIGELPARAYRLVPLEELTPEQLGRLGIPRPKN